MNKQQLASRIWESANRMRSKIEANEYKDYILGFILPKKTSRLLMNPIKKQFSIFEKISASLFPIMACFQRGWKWVAILVLA